jgi:hypothetical protein
MPAVFTFLLLVISICGAMMSNDTRIAPKTAREASWNGWENIEMVSVGVMPQFWSVLLPGELVFGFPMYWRVGS